MEEQDKTKKVYRDEKPSDNSNSEYWEDELIEIFRAPSPPIGTSCLFHLVE